MPASFWVSTQNVILEKFSRARLSVADGGSLSLYALKNSTSCHDFSCSDKVSENKYLLEPFGEMQELLDEKLLNTHPRSKRTALSEHFSQSQEIQIVDWFRKHPHPELLPRWQKFTFPILVEWDTIICFGVNQNQWRRSRNDALFQAGSQTIGVRSDTI